MNPTPEFIASLRAYPDRYAEHIVARGIIIETSRGIRCIHWDGHIEYDTFV